MSWPPPARRKLQRRCGVCSPNSQGRSPARIRSPTGMSWCCISCWNVVGFALVGGVGGQGWLGGSSPPTRVALSSTSPCSWSGWCGAASGSSSLAATSRRSGATPSEPGARGSLLDTPRGNGQPEPFPPGRELRMGSAAVSPVRHLANSLVLLGLIGRSSASSSPCPA